jgi:hypothetical protein
MDRGYFRPGLRSTLPAIQRRLENIPGANIRKHEKDVIVGGLSNDVRNGVGIYGSKFEDSASSPTSSTSLIRLTLKKPMGIVFEPMMDPHNLSQQRGVRICDLPRTGAAALSRKLEISDELLSINDKTMSRLTFDEIMDFIVKADPDNVNLLFRRPRKEQLLNGTSGGGIALGPSFGLTTNTNNATSKSVNWVDDPNVAPAAETIVNIKEKYEKSKNINENPSRTSRRQLIDDESIVTADDTTYTQETEEPLSGRSRRRYDRKRHSKRYSRHYTSENFLDKLIDSICAPLVGESTRIRDHGHDVYSDDDLTMNSADDSTFLTSDSPSYVHPHEKKDIRNVEKSSHSVGRSHRKNKSIEEGFSVDDDNNVANDFVMKVSGKRNIETKPHVCPHSSSSHIHTKESKPNSDNIKSDISEPQVKGNFLELHSQEDRNQFSISKDTDPLQYQEDIIPEGTYEDDATLETVGTLECAKAAQNIGSKSSSVKSSTPLGLALPQESIQTNGLTINNVETPENHFKPHITSQGVPILTKENEEHNCHYSYGYIEHSIS